jgi:hypothetical protein
MHRRLLSLGSSLALMGAIAVAVPAIASASTPTAIPVAPVAMKLACTVPLAAQSAVSADIAAGDSAAQACADGALYAPPGSGTAGSTSDAASTGVTADDLSGEYCGTAYDYITDNDPRGGWFHEQPTWDMDDTGYIETATIQALWANYTTDNSSSYTWNWSGFANEADEDRDVYSMAGNVQAQSAITGSVYSSELEEYGVCQGVSDVESFYVSPS